MPMALPCKGGMLYGVRATARNGTGYAGTPQGLQTVLAQGDAVIAQSPPNGASTIGIVANHAYAVTAVFYQNGTWNVRLYNPWGMNLENGIATGDGFITLTWQQFTNSANFLGFFVAKA